MNKKEEDLAKIIKKGTGFEDVVIKDITIIKGIKTVSADCTIEPGIKKQCHFSIENNELNYGKCFPKKEEE